MTPRIFTPEYVRKTLAREATRRFEDQTDQYRLCQDECEELRDQVEEWSCDIPEGIPFNRLRGALLSNEHFWHAYNELAARNCLKQLGYQVEYEPSLHGLSPDFLVIGRGISFYMEFFSKDAAEPIASHARNVSTLNHYLRNLEVGATIAIHDMGVESLQASHVRPLVDAIENWLLTSPIVGDSIDTHDFNIMLISHREGRQGVHSIGLGVGFCVDGEPIADTLKRKLDQYCDAISEVAMPFVVAISPAFETGLSIASVEDILFGQEQVTYCFNQTTGVHLGASVSRAPDGRFSKSELLSAVVLFRGGGQNWSFDARFNPEALHAIPEDSFLPFVP